MFPPERIVCLTEETVETLYLLGEDRRIVGVSGYAVRPPRVRRGKPRVSAFISADVPKILTLKPDLVLTFSDLQADIVADLIRNNIAVHAFNQRDVAGILDMIRTLGALVGVAKKADALADSLAAHIDEVHERALLLPRRPRVYFEEWDEPMISGIAWVSELIEAAGGIEVFPQLAVRKNATDRIVPGSDVIAARPDGRVIAQIKDVTGALLGYVHGTSGAFVTASEMALGREDSSPALAYQTKGGNSL